MVGLAPHQTSPHQVESANLHQQDDFLNLERERDREKYQEGSVHTTHTSGSHFRREATSPTGEMIIKPCNERLIT